MGKNKTDGMAASKGIAKATLLLLGGITAAPATFAQNHETATPAITQSDVNYQNYRFRDGETLKNLRVHYAAMGMPHLNKSGEIDNAVLVLHWTGNSGASLLTPEYIHCLLQENRWMPAAIT